MLRRDRISVGVGRDDVRMNVDDFGRHVGLPFGDGVLAGPCVKAADTR
jgi:hypothetical protein